MDIAGRLRRWSVQGLLLLAVAGVAWLLWRNTAANMASHGMSLNFAFLDNPAGFAVSQHLLPYQESDSYARVFVVGLLNTLLVSALAIVAATILGTVVGVLRVSRNWLMRQLAAVYVELFRNVPLLLQLFFWYFAVLAVLPAPRASTLRWGCEEAGCLAALSNRGLVLAAPLWQAALQWAVAAFVSGVIAAFLLRGWNRRRQRRSGQVLRLWWAYALLVVVLPLAVFFALVEPAQVSRPLLQGFNFRGGVTLLPELLALWLALSLYSASYVAEYVRSGIASVPRGQYEAAESLGLPPARVMRLVVLPQALRVMVPPLTSQFANVVKNSSLATAIAYPDLVSVFTGTALNQTGRAVEIIVMTMAVYLAISLVISLLMNGYNRRVRLVER
ncbi:amino acid ABC transporter permease [Cardiobacterium valvarum]|uniref:Putative general L-amino acid transport system permease protein AapQ n=1 Tax=Cardiobacterium valvarum F0432 TaxID=797473 RepID=G9ZH61_9GAMM|nr:ABC transporter permease subunit [Cardiobacterium valvarum]EHM52813.1 putative general L-amino acid transport system permease protein AapQ [Cardiobacterium valvarum F0432]